MLGWTSSDIRQCVIATGMAMAISFIGVGSCWTFIYPFQMEKDHYLSLCTDGPSVLHLRLDIEQYSAKHLGSISRKQGQIDLRILAKADPGTHGCRYTCSLVGFEWKDGTGRSALRFERSPSYSHSYSWGEHLSEKERESYSKVLHLNWNTPSIFSDHSLLTQQFSVFVNRRGGIDYLKLPPAWVKTFTSGLKGSGLEALSSYLSSHKLRFPDLLASGSQSWVTVGWLGDSIKMHTQMRQADGYLMKARSSASMPIGHQAEQDLELSWIYDQKQASVPSLQLEYSYSVQPGNRNALASAGVHVSAQIVSFESEDVREEHSLF